MMSTQRFPIIHHFSKKRTPNPLPGFRGSVVFPHFRLLSYFLLWKSVLLVSLRSPKPEPFPIASALCLQAVPLTGCLPFPSLNSSDPSTGSPSSLTSFTRFPRTTLSPYYRSAIDTERHLTWMVANSQTAPLSKHYSLCRVRLSDIPAITPTVCSRAGF